MYVALHFYLSLSSFRSMARIVMDDSGEGVWDTRVVADWDGHGSKMKEKSAAFHNLLLHGWDDRVSTISTTRYYTVPQCGRPAQDMVRFNVLSVSSRRRYFVHTIGFEVKSCSDFKRPRSMLAVAAEIIGAQGLRANGLVLECTLGPAVRNDVVDFPSGESMTQNTIIYSTLIECLCTPTSSCSWSWWACPCRQVLARWGEVARLFGHVKIDIPKASKETPSVTAPSTVPGPSRKYQA